MYNKHIGNKKSLKLKILEVDIMKNLFLKFNGMEQIESNYSNFVSVAETFGYAVKYGEESIVADNGAECFILDYCSENIKVRHIEI